MTFYLKPPRGLTSLEKVRVCAQKRLRFLCHMSTCTTQDDIDSLVKGCCVVEFSEYLIDGTPADRMSHYILCLLTCECPELSMLIVDAETKLFQYRYINQSKRERKHLLSTISRHIKEILTHSSASDTFSGFLVELSNVIRQLSAGNSIIQVQFQYITEMVRSRDVELKSGIGLVPSGMQLNLMMELFRSSLIQGFHQMSNSTSYQEMKEDQRLLEISTSLQKEFDQRCENSEEHCKQAISSVDNEANLFPLCMHHLHNVLRQNHRLKHHSRIQYTLFLKDIGLSVNDALQFWKEEYSKDGHSIFDGAKVNVQPNKWRNSCKRYEYGIRHLYGLEGSRKNYKSHCCSALQTLPPNTAEEGGCPFVYFDEQYLFKYLTTIGINTKDIEEMNVLRKDGCYHEACRLFMQAQSQKHLRLVKDDLQKIMKQGRSNFACKYPKKQKLDGQIKEIPSFDSKDCIHENKFENTEGKLHFIVNTSEVSNNILNTSVSSSVCSDHLCCPSQTLYVGKPALIYDSFKRLLNDLKSLE